MITIYPLFKGFFAAAADDIFMNQGSSPKCDLAQILWTIFRAPADDCELETTRTPGVFRGFRRAQVAERAQPTTRTTDI
jgi:hypothetical protein